MFCISSSGSSSKIISCRLRILKSASTRFNFVSKFASFPAIAAIFERFRKRFLSDKEVLLFVA
nr:hypothetical protein Iba_scaffold61396CG0010 [Ipomoea batatas]